MSTIPGRSRTAATLAAFLLAASGGLARATTIAIPVLQDATLYGGTAADHSGSGPGLFVGTDAQRFPKRGLIEFDVAQYVPAEATVTGVSLQLTLGQIAGTGGGDSAGGSTTPRTIALYDLAKPWRGSTNGTAGYAGPGFGGTGQGFAANRGDATWNDETFDTVPWTRPGGDFAAAESADVIAGDTVGAATVWGSTAQMVSDVQGWLDGTLPNDGWLLKNDDETDAFTYRAFYTREGALEQGVPQLAPALTVTFAVPEPASAALVAFGVIGVAATRFRRRA